MIFGVGIGDGPEGATAARHAAEEANAAFADKTPKLGIVFSSPSFPATAGIVRTVRDVVGAIPIVGGTSGGRLISSAGVTPGGVTVVLLGGEDLRIETRAVRIEGPELFDVVNAAREIARAADEASRDGLGHYACLSFAPAIDLNGEALVAAIRKGAGARAQLAGGLTGDDLTFDRMGVFVGEELRNDHVVLAGVFTRKPIGIAARHGYRPIGKQRIVTRAEGNVVVELDRRPALDVWLEDARRAGATLPDQPAAIERYLTLHQGLGIGDPSGRAPDAGELVVRTPFAVERDGRVRLASAIGEGLRVHVMQANRKELLRASTSAAADAVMRARTKIAGALVLPCSGRLAVLDDEFTEECRLIRDRIGAPIGGACVFGEIAKTDRDHDAFFNTTVVVAAFPS